MRSKTLHGVAPSDLVRSHLGLSDLSGTKAPSERNIHVLSESERAILAADRVLSDAARFRAAWYRENSEKKEQAQRIIDLMSEVMALREENVRLMTIVETKGRV